MMAGTAAAEVQTSANQVQQLDQHVQALNAQRERFDQKRAATTAALRIAKESRATACEHLLTAGQDEEAGIHKRIDSLDAAIREESRILEGLNRAIEKLDEELAGVHEQLGEARVQSQREAEAREIEAERAQLLELQATAMRLSDEFVEALARFNIAGHAFAERGPLHQNFATEAMDGFISRHNSRGGMMAWRYELPGIAPNLQLMVRPMLPPGAKP